MRPHANAPLQEYRVELVGFMNVETSQFSQGNIIPSVQADSGERDLPVSRINMSQAKSQSVSFHPSQLTGKASSSNPGNEWKDFTEDEDNLDENQVCATVLQNIVC